MEPHPPPEVEDASRTPLPSPEHHRDLDSVFIGPHGLRVGWSILLFAALYYLFREIIATFFYVAGLIHDTPPDPPAPSRSLNSSRFSRSSPPP